MLFSKKKARALAEQNAALFTQTLTEMNEELSLIGAMPDAGERYLALDALHESIRLRQFEIGEMIERQTQSASKGMDGKLGQGSAWLALSGIVVLVSAVVIVSPIVAMAGIGAFGAGTVTLAGNGIYDALVRSGKKKIICNNIGDFFKAAEMLMQEIVVQKTALVENQMPGLARSARFTEVCEKFPAVGVAFAKASAAGKLIDKHDKPLKKLVPRHPFPG